MEAYATGNHSIISLREELIDRGLTTVPTPRRPSKPPVLSTIYPYFMCTGRHAKRINCERESMPVPDIGAAVEDHYRNVQIPEHVLPPLRKLVTSEFDRLHQVSKHEPQGYKTERDALRDERTKLMQAHDAGAVPLGLLATEQDRIAGRLTFLDAQINAGDIENERTKEQLDDCLALTGDMHAIYMSIDDSLRRIAD